MPPRPRLPDEAFVVRCGKPPFANPLFNSSRHHPEGFHGFSLHAAVSLSVEELASACVNNSVGFTSVGEIRMMGYDVVSTSGEGYHATVVPIDWTAEAADRLTSLFQAAKNPAPKRRS